MKKEPLKVGDRCAFANTTKSGGVVFLVLETRVGAVLLGRTDGRIEPGPDRWISRPLLVRVEG